MLKIDEKIVFTTLKIIVLLDGLNAKGPMVEVYRINKWQFMIVLKDDAIPSVENEFEALASLETKNHHRRTWGNRTKFFGGSTLSIIGLA